jgi:hypothetical protein
MAKERRQSSVRVSFAYDRELLEDFKKTFPSARWDGSSKQWVIPGVRAAKRYDAWRDAAKDKMLSAAAAKEAATNAARKEAIAKISASSDNHKHLRIGVDGLRLSFQYDPALVQAVKRIKGAYWNSGAKEWTVPFGAAEEAKKIAEKIGRVEQARQVALREEAKSKAAEAKRREEQRAKARASRVPVVPGSVASGQTLTVAGRVVTVEGLGKLFRVDDSFSSLHGSQWLGREGGRVQYAYFRDATEPEVAAHKQREAAKQAAAAAAQAERQKRETVRAAMDKVIDGRGVRPPVGQAEPRGKTVLDVNPQNRIYGGGVEYKLHGSTLYRIAGNGMDGDDFSRNNYGGAVVDKVKLSRRDVAEFREASGRPAKGSAAFPSSALDRHVKTLADYDRRIGRDPSVRHGVLAAAGKFEVEELLKRNPAASAADKAAAYARPFSRATGRIAASASDSIAAMQERRAARGTTSAVPQKPKGTSVAKSSKTTGTRKAGSSPKARSPDRYALILERLRRSDNVAATTDVMRQVQKTLGKEGVRAVGGIVTGAPYPKSATASSIAAAVVKKHQSQVWYRSKDRADARGDMWGKAGGAQAPKGGPIGFANPKVQAAAQAARAERAKNNAPAAKPAATAAPAKAAPAQAAPAKAAPAAAQSQTVAQMRAAAKEAGITGASKMNKGALQAALDKAKSGGPVGFANPDVQAAAQKALQKQAKALGIPRAGNLDSSSLRAAIERAEAAKAQPQIAARLAAARSAPRADLVKDIAASYQTNVDPVQRNNVLARRSKTSLNHMAALETPTPDRAKLLALQETGRTIRTASGAEFKSAWYTPPTTADATAMSSLQNREARYKAWLAAGKPKSGPNALGLAAMLGPAAIAGAAYVAFDSAQNAAHASGSSKGQAAAAGIGAGAVAAGTVAATGLAIGKAAKMAASLAPVAGKVLARALPALAAGMALYETGKGAIEGYKQGGAVGAAKGAAMGLADFITMGGASALASRLSQPTAQTGTLAIAQKAAGATTARMATTGTMLAGGRRMSADGMAMPDGMTEGYFRQQNGKSVFVTGYKTPDARR